MRRMLSWLVTFGLLVGSTAARATGVVVGDLEWRQLTETVGFNFDQIATVCDPTDGVCQGSLGSVSFDGWTWASNHDLQTLFDELIDPGSTQFPAIDSLYQAVDDPWFAAVFDSYGFEDLTSFTSLRGIRGWSRTPGVSINSAYVPYLFDNDSSTATDTAYLGVYSFTNTTFNSETGVWLFRTAIVPEPGSFSLLAVGLLTLCVKRHPGPRRHRS